MEICHPFTWQMLGRKGFAPKHSTSFCESITMDGTLTHNPSPQKILVVGVGRSGTTSIYSLLQTIFEEQFPGNNEYVYEPFLWDRDSFGKRYSDVVPLFKEVDSVSPTGIHNHLSIPLFCNSYSDLTSESRNWVHGLWNASNYERNSIVKMIRGCGRLELIRQLVPEVKIIAVFRNPMDVINSSIKMFSFFGSEFHRCDYDRFVAETNLDASKTPISKTDDEVEREVQFWDQMVQHVVQAYEHNSENILPVLHEQFVNDRESVIRQICEFTGTTFQKMYATTAEERVGPSESSNNNLCAEEYLHLEEYLYSYAEQMSKISSFDVRSLVKEIKQKYITKTFIGERKKRCDSFNGHHASNKLAQEQRWARELQQRVTELEQQLHQFQDSAATANNSRSGDLRNQLNVLQVEFNQKNSDLSRSKSELANAHLQIQQLQSQLQSHSEPALQKLQQTQARCSELELQLVESAKKISQAQTAKSNVESQLNQLTSDLKSANETIKRHDNSLSAANSKIEHLSQLIADRDTEIDSLSKRLDESKEHQENCQAMALQMEELSAKYQLEVNAAEDLLRREKNLNQQLSASIASHEIELGETRRKVDQLNSDFEGALRAKNDAQQQLKIASTNEQSLNEQRQFDNMAVEALKDDLQIQNQKLNQYEVILSQLRNLSDYPFSQIDRKARAYRKLIRTYNRIKPAWHKSKTPDYNSRYRNKLRATVQQHGVDMGNQLDAFYGNHRSGWAYAVNSLRDIHNTGSVYLDTFIERTFCWSPEGIKPHLRPWIGFIHVPPFVPGWFQYNQSNHTIFQTSAWKESLPFCRGLITLSKYHRDFLQPKFDFPIDNLIHPTEFPDQTWSYRDFETNSQKRIVQLGWWLRKLHAIYQLPESSYTKTLLRTSEKPYLQELFEKEKQQLLATGEFHEGMYKTVDVMKFLPNDQYDQLLSNNIAFLNLYDSSANNSVIECIARGTPLLVNRIRPVEEYLGPEYPFYYDSLREAVNKAMDFSLVKETHEYLMNCETRKKLTGEYFKQSLMESDVLLNVYQDFSPIKRAA